MLTIQLLAEWFALSATIYLIGLLMGPFKEFTRAGANIMFLASQAMAAAVLAYFV